MRASLAGIQAHRPSGKRGGEEEKRREQHPFRAHLLQPPLSFTGLPSRLLQSIPRPGHLLRDQEPLDADIYRSQGAPDLFGDALGKYSARGARGDQRSSMLVWADVREKSSAPPPPPPLVPRGL